MYTFVLPENRKHDMDATDPVLACQVANLKCWGLPWAFSCALGYQGMCHRRMSFLSSNLISLITHVFFSKLFNSCWGGVSIEQ